MWTYLCNLPDYVLFGPAAQGTRWRARLLRGARYPYALLRDLLAGQLNLYAMGLVYTTLLAMIPLLAFSFALLKAFGAHRLLEPLVYDFFSPMGSAAGEFTRRVMDFAENVRAGLVGSVGLALLIWTLIGTIKKVEDGFNFVWHVELARSFTRRIAEYMALIVIGPLAVAALIGLSRLAADSAPLRLLSQLPLLDRLMTLGLILSPFVIVSGLLTAIYVFSPNTTVRVRPALIGGIFAGVLWTIVGRLFTLFVLYSSRLTLVYAGFAIIVTALVWTYLGWIILLLGAQLSFYVQNPSYLRLGLAELRLSGADTERLGLSIMYLVARSHQTGAPRWSIDALAKQLELPGVAIARMSAALEAAGLLAATADETFLPGRDVAQIRLLEIVTIVRQHSSGHRQTVRHTPPGVEKFCEALEQSWLQCCADRSLDDLLEAPVNSTAYPPAIIIPSTSTEPT